MYLFYVLLFKMIKTKRITEIQSSFCKILYQLYEVIMSEYVFNIKSSKPTTLSWIGRLSSHIKQKEITILVSNRKY